MNNAKKQWIYWASVILPVAVLLLISAVVEYTAFDLHLLDWTVPVSYGGDGITGVSSISNSLTGSDARLGWPFYQDTSAYSNINDMNYRIFVSFCGLFIKDTGTLYNVYTLGIPFLNVLVCYLVFRCLRVRSWLSVAGALTFGFCPYVQYRLGGHQCLAAVYCIPLVLLLCLWCWEDPRFNRPGKGWAHYPRNWVALLFAFFIANNGIVYYPYFGCFFLCVIALCEFLRQRKIKAMTAPLTTVAMIGGWVAVGFLPTIAGIFAGVGNTATNNIGRDKIGPDIYSLRISSMLLDRHGYGWPRLGRFIESYFNELARAEGVVINENACAFMGIVALLAFFALLLVLLVTPSEERLGKQLQGRLWLFSRLLICGLLLGTMTGFGAIIGIALKMLRGYNRISPYLVCICVFTVVLFCEWLLQNVKARQVVSAVIAAVFLYGFVDQLGYYRPAYESVQVQWAQDDRFGAELEQVAGESALVFQLPYMQSFENGWQYNMPDYTLLRPLLHTQTLRFSYGAGIGSENDVWYKNTVELDAGDMIAVLREKGFAGIYLDRDGFADTELEECLCRELGLAVPTLTSEDGKLIYLSLDTK